MFEIKIEKVKKLTPKTSLFITVFFILLALISFVYIYQVYWHPVKDLPEVVKEESASVPALQIKDHSALDKVLQDRSRNMAELNYTGNNIGSEKDPFNLP